MELILDNLGVQDAYIPLGVLGGAGIHVSQRFGVLSHHVVWQVLEVRK